MGGEQDIEIERDGEGENKRNERDQRQTVKQLRRRETLNEGEGKSNSVLQGEVVFRFCSWPHQL